MKGASGGATSAPTTDLQICKVMRGAKEGVSDGKDGMKRGLNVRDY